MADELAGDGPVRVDSPGIRGGRDALYALFLHPGRRLGLYARGNDAISREVTVSITPGERRSYLLLGRASLFTEYGGQPAGGSLIVLYLVRSRYHARDLEARRELPSVCAPYAAAGQRRYRGLSSDLFVGEGSVVLVFREANVHGPSTEQESRHHEDRGHHPQPPVADVGPGCAVARRAGCPGRATLRTAGTPLPEERYDLPTGRLAASLFGAGGIFRAAANPGVAGP